MTVISLVGHNLVTRQDTERATTTRNIPLQEQIKIFRERLLQV